MSLIPAPLRTAATLLTTVMSNTSPANSEQASDGHKRTRNFGQSGSSAGHGNGSGNHNKFIDLSKTEEHHHHEHGFKASAAIGAVVAVVAVGAVAGATYMYNTRDDNRGDAVFRDAHEPLAAEEIVETIEDETTTTETTATVVTRGAPRNISQVHGVSSQLSTASALTGADERLRKIREQRMRLREARQGGHGL